MSLNEFQRNQLIENREEAQTRLLRWFEQQARDLPWRHQRTPYRVWVAEVMLQQTQAETVVGYYERFLARFPSVEVLARSSLEDVLKAWEGLGYYSRARALHRAALQVIEDHKGELPSDPAALQSLPGIGPYTAGAIASIAFGIVVPAIDGNARRVMARILALPDPKQQELEEALRLWISETAPGAFNEALMELGATLCPPRSPRCLLCPWQAFCQARNQGEQETYPAPRQRKPIPHYDVAAAVIVARRCSQDSAQMLVAQRPTDAMLGGLWEFPGGKREEGESLPQALKRELQEEMGIEIHVGQLLIVIQHAYTHFRITLHAFICELESGEPRCLECQDFQWASQKEVDALPMAVTDRKIAQAIEGWLES